MPRYEALLSCVLRRVERGEGRRTGASLSFDLLSACVVAFVESTAALGATPRASPADVTPSISTPPQDRPLVSRTVAQDVMRDAVRILVSHPHRRSFLASERVDRAVITMFTNAALMPAGKDALLPKDLAAAVVGSTSVKEQTSAKLILLLHVLSRFTSADGGELLTEEGDVRSHPSQLHSAPSLRAAFMVAAREVVGRLPPVESDDPSPPLFPSSQSERAPAVPQPKAGRQFQRRNVASLENSSASGCFANATAADVRGEEGAGQGLDVSIRQMCKTSSTTSVTDAEFLLLLSALLKASMLGDKYLGTAATPEETEELRLMIARAAPRLHTLPLLRSSGSRTPARPEASPSQQHFTQLQLLLWLACHPVGMPSLAQFALRRLQQCQDATSAGQGAAPLAALSATQLGTLRADAVRLLLSYEKEAARYPTAAAPDKGNSSSSAHEQLSIFSVVMPLLFRDSGNGAPSGNEGGANPFRNAVGHLSNSHQAQLYFLLLRIYHLHLGELRRHSMEGAVTLASEQIRDLDSLMEAVRDRSKLEIKDNPIAFAAPVDVLEVESRALQLLIHSHPNRGAHTGGSAAAGTQFLAFVSALVEKDDSTLQYLREWQFVLEALSLWQTERPQAVNAAERLEAASLFAAVLRRMTGLLAASSNSSLDRRAAFVLFKKAILLSTISLLKRLWLDDLQHLPDEALLLAFRGGICEFLESCVMQSATESNSLSGAEMGQDATPHETAEASVTAVALQLLLSLDAQDAGTGKPSPVNEERISPGAGRTHGGTAEEQEPLSPTVVKDAIAHTLQSFGRKKAMELVPSDLLHVFHTTTNMLHLGVFDPAMLALAAAAIRNVSAPENLVRLSWRSRATLLRRCLQLYHIMEPHFSSQSGCRQIGQQCLVVPTRLCLEKYAPVAHCGGGGGHSRRGPPGSGGEAHESAATCAALVWSLCVMAVQRPLRKSSLDKYLIVMARFARRYWAEPPATFLSFPREKREAMLAVAEGLLCDAAACRRRDRSSGSLTQTKPSVISETDAVLSELVAFNADLHHMAVQLMPLTFAVAREEREVRARKIKRYYELYFTMCFLLSRHQAAVAPSVWHVALQHAINFPRIFSPSDNFQLTLQKVLEVSARQVLRFVQAKDNKGEWADARSRRAASTDAAPPVLLSPAMVSRVFNVVGSLTNVNARLALIDLAQEAVAASPAELIATLPRRTNRSSADGHRQEYEKGGEGREEKCGHGEKTQAEALRRAEREEMNVLLNVINGLRSAGRRTRAA